MIDSPTSVPDNLRYTAMWNASQLMTEVRSSLFSLSLSKSLTWEHLCIQDISENRRAIKAKTSPSFKPLKAPAKL